MTAICDAEIPLNWAGRGRSGRPRRSRVPAQPRIPRIARLMALAIKFQDMVDRGEVRDYADLARLGFVTRARLTQIMNLLLLAPDIQDALLTSSTLAGNIPERGLRRITAVVRWSHQRRLWSELLSKLSTER